jgi:MFS family permease
MRLRTDISADPGQENQVQKTGKRRLFYGWIVVAGAFLSFAVSAGVMHSFTVFFVAFLQAFSWSRADASVAYAISQLIGGASAPLIGILVDRLGPRRLVLSGGIILTVGLAVQLCISWVGWRASYLILSAFMAILVFPLVRFFQIREPGEMGLFPDGPGTTEASTPVSAPGKRRSPVTAPLIREWSLWEAMRTRHLWLLFGVYMFTGLGSFFVSLHQLAFAADLGFDKLYAAGVLGVGSFLTIAGIIGIGTISDYIGREIAAILAYQVSIIGVICALLIWSPEQHWLLWLHACFFGLTWGARGPLITAKAADLFQGKHLGAIYGVISMGTGIGAAVGSWASGLIFDLTGSYRLAFLLSIASYLGGCITFWLLRRPPIRASVELSDDDASHGRLT